jgi:hypothetical protein
MARNTCGHTAGDKRETSGSLERQFADRGRAAPSGEVVYLEIKKEEL